MRKILIGVAVIICVPTISSLPWNSLQADLSQGTANSQIECSLFVLAEGEKPSNVRIKKYMQKWNTSRPSSDTIIFIKIFAFPKSRERLEKTSWCTGLLGRDSDPQSFAPRCRYLSFSELWQGELCALERLRTYPGDVIHSYEFIICIVLSSFLSKDAYIAHKDYQTDEQSKKHREPNGDKPVDSRFAISRYT